ncbi:hypothetical protein MUP79_05910, partial [Candidatus Bathyarchaeota archaeon]|nr:hypothetical protein [Candidatus Bathyarchaeota archaeon]
TYHVATVSVAVSYDEAINISRQYIEAFAQENQLNTVSISATLNYTIDGIAQRGDSFAIYPFWYVKGIYDKTAQGYNANSYSVIIWADNGSISGEGPDAGGIGPGPSAAVNPLLFLVPAGFGIFVLGTGTYIRRKSKTRRALSWAIAQALWAGFDGMSAKWVSVLLSVGGLVLDVLGLFLPWAELSKPLGRFGGLMHVLGINAPFGVNVLSVIGVLVAVLSWTLFIVRKHRPLLALAAGGGIWIMTCAFAWIVDPGTLFGAFRSSEVFYGVSYGVYVSLAGGALSFAGAALGLCQSSLPPISPVLSFLRKRRIGILLFAVVLTVGLGLGMVSVAFLFPTHTEPSWKSAVLVSGTISQTQPHNGTIYFDSMDMDHTVGTKANITDGKYSVLLVGGLWYTVSFYSGDIHHPVYSYTLYVPSNVTAFTANF